MTSLYDVEAHLRPLLGLVMIVKDEAHGVVATLDTFLPWVDRVTILDTGSTDGTPDVLRDRLAQSGGWYGGLGAYTLHEEPFVDFATSRNRALDLHGETSVFTIMPDSDDRLVDGETLRTFLERRRVNTNYPAFNINVRMGDLSYYLPLVARTVAKRRYTGRVHEYSPESGVNLPASVKLCKHGHAQSLAISQQRWQRDALWLEEDLVADPTNHRNWFYLGQTYEYLGEPKKALAAYAKRLMLPDGWYEEGFEARFRYAKLLHQLGRCWGDVQQAFLECHQYNPQRAEPLYEIAKYHHGHDDHVLTYLFASAATDRKLPATTFFVDRAVYEWKAADLMTIAGFYLDAETVDRSRCRALLDHMVVNAPEDEQGRIRNNRAFYAQSADQTFAGVKIVDLAFTPPPNYHALNPSIHYNYADGVLRCVVRTVNYQIVNGQYLTPDDNIIFTRNFMLELADDLTVTWTIEMVESPQVKAISKTTYPVHGFEDCRLFYRNGLPYCSATVCDFAPVTDLGRREIVVMQLDPNTYEIVEVHPQRFAHLQEHQKNWMPFGPSPFELAQSFAPQSDPHFLYSVVPPVTITANTDALFQTREVLPRDRLRGGSQAIWVTDGVDSGYLCVVHDVTFSGKDRIYLHRFVLMQHDGTSLTVAKMSELFYFEQLGIEFCAGLTHVDGYTGNDDDRLIASFGVNDSQAKLAVFSLSAVLAGLSTKFVI